MPQTHTYGTPKSFKCLRPLRVLIWHTKWILLSIKSEKVSTTNTKWRLKAVFGIMNKSIYIKTQKASEVGKDVTSLTQNEAFIKEKTLVITKSLKRRTVKMNRDDL